MDLGKKIEDTRRLSEEKRVDIPECLKICHVTWARSLYVEA